MPAVERTAELLELITERNAKIGVTGSIVDHLQFPKDAIAKIGGDFLREDVIDEKSRSQASRQLSIMEKLYH